MQVLIELDEQTLRQLEEVAPARSRKRSAFIRAAVQKALWELEEERTRKAYLADPDHEPLTFDPAMWEPLPYGGFEPPQQRGRARAMSGRPKDKLERGQRSVRPRARK